jgi:hypothetical protein
VLMAYRWPDFTLADAASFLRLLMVIVAAAGLMWVLRLWLAKPSQNDRVSAGDPQAP